MRIITKTILFFRKKKKKKKRESKNRGVQVVLRFVLRHKGIRIKINLSRFFLDSKMNTNTETISFAEERNYEEKGER